MAFVANPSMIDNVRAPENGLQINRPSSLNRPELATSYNYAETSGSNGANSTDTAVLTSNQLPSPTSPEDVPVSENPYGIPHKQLALQLSEPTQKPVPMVDSYMRRPVMRVKSVTTPGGRVVRNINMNNSVKYDISTAFERYSTAFSSYKNPFRSVSIDENVQQPQQQQQHQQPPRPSLRRDGKVRRASRHERTDSGKSMPVASSENDFVNKNRKPSSTFTHQMSTESCTSVTSNTQLVNNPYNTVNQKIYSAMWCPCFIFCFLCSFPAIESMKRSDKFFDENNYNKARTYARLSTALFILGIILTIAFVAAILAVIILFTVKK